MSRVKWAIVGCMILAGSSAFAETSKPRNILEFLFGTSRSEQPVAITPAPPAQITAPAGAPRARADKKASKKTASRQSIDSDGGEGPRRSLRKGHLNPIDPEKQASGSYTGPFRGAGNQAYCVRTCDGFFFPVNHEGAKGSDRYDSVCEQSCPGAQTQVFFMKRGGDIRYSSTARGKPYASLENALKYRKERDISCSCKSQDQNWSSILSTVEPKLRHNKADLVVTPEISQRIAQGEDAMAILKAGEQTNAKQAAAVTEKPIEFSNRTATPSIRASFGNKIAPADKFMKIDPEPTGSIPAGKPLAPRAEPAQPKPDKLVLGKPAPGKPMPDKSASPATGTAKLASTPQKPGEKAWDGAKKPPAKVASNSVPAKSTDTPARGETSDKLALRQALDRLIATDKRQ